jgi:hypothetical protein
LGSQLILLYLALGGSDQFLIWNNARKIDFGAMIDLIKRQDARGGG